MLHLESDIGSGAGGFPLTTSGVVGEGDGLAGCRASLQIMGNPGISAILLDVFIGLDGHVNSVLAVRIFGGRGDTANAPAVRSYVLVGCAPVSLAHSTFTASLTALPRSVMI